MEAQGILTLVRGLVDAQGLGREWDFMVWLQPTQPIQILNAAAVCAKERQMEKKPTHLYVRKNG